MNRLVLDTNVLLSGLIRGGGPPGRIVDALRTGAVLPVVDDRILDEYERVLRRPFFSRYFGQTEIDSVLSFVVCNGEQIVASCRVSDLPDESDAAFAEVALTAGVPLVTGNVRHFPPAKVVGLEVMTPSEFARTL
jgi:putative PIN family toxin of toxin-antitoxin system